VDLVSNPHNKLKSLRIQLSNFIQWYLSQENINNVSIFQSLRDISTEMRNTKLAMSSILSIERKIKEALPDLDIGKSS
jgi:hypothetical protein